MTNNPVFALIRPRPASVIAVIWLYLGGSWAFMGTVMAWLGASMLSFGHARPLDRIPLEMVFTGCWCLAVTALGAAGVWGALGLLKLRASGRARLEKVNFISAGLIASFGLYWAHTALSMQMVTELELRVALISALFACVSCAPFLWMAKALRGQDVRNACELQRDF